MCNCGKNRQPNPQPVTHAQPTPIRTAIAFRPSVSVEDPATWGPTLWKILHTLAEFSDRPRIITHWNSVVRVLLTTIPCPQCRLHYSQYVKANPLRMNVAQDAIQPYIVTYFFDMHTNVNTINNKPLATTDVLPKGDRQQLLTDLAADIQTVGRSFGGRFINSIRTLVRVLS